VTADDGLVETHGSDIDLRIDRVGAELKAACADGLDLDKMADRVIAGRPPVRRRAARGLGLHAPPGYRHRADVRDSHHRGRARPGPGPARVRRTDTEVAVIVCDRGRYQPQPRLADPTDESGRAA
jgi:hypothetical protein